MKIKTITMIAEINGVIYKYDVLVVNVVAYLFKGYSIVPNSLILWEED